MSDTTSPPRRSFLRRAGSAVQKAFVESPTQTAELAMARARQMSRYGSVDGNGPQNTPPKVEAAIVEQGMDPTRSFSPGVPIGPFDGYSSDPRRFNFQTGANITARPRQGYIGFDTMRSIIDSYDVARMCIDHRINDIRSLGWRVEALPGFEKDADDVLPIARQILKYPDRFTDDEGTVYTEGQPFNSWLAAYLRDLFSFDAGSLYRRRDKAGRVRCLDVVDGTTLAPMLDYHGRRPQSPAPAFVQFIQGVPWDWLTTDDAVYVPFWPRSSSPYGMPAIENILLNANTDIRFQWWFLQVFTDGTLPAGFATAPPDQSEPEQVRSWQAMWDAIMGGGDQAQQHKLKWVPNGVEFTFPRDPVFDKDFALFLMRKTCASFGVTPNDLGFTDDVNRATGDTQVDVQFRIGTKPVTEHVQGIVDAYLQDDRGLPVQFRFDVGQEIEDRLSDAEIWKIAIETGAASSDEFRADVLGLPVDETRPVPRFVMTSHAGPVPLAAIMAAAGKIDAETGAPSEDAVLPEMPFAPIVGIEPAKPPAATSVEIDPSTVEQGDGQEAAGAASVAKAETVGMTAETGITSYDLIDDDETDPKDLEDENPGAEVPRSVLKLAVPTLIAAGLVVQAADTGRVLMIQRWHGDPEDPAAGLWEFPGGHVEPGEDSFVAACREWCEETGAPMPEGTLEATWISRDGVYQGFAYLCATEDEVDINLSDDRMVLNPDDPDGDQIEVAAWWDVEHIAGNPAVRPEVQQIPFETLVQQPVVDERGVTDDEEVVKEWRRWRDNARSRVRKGQAPRLFSSSVLDGAEVDAAWSLLRVAKTRDQVDAVFEPIVKASLGKDQARHPGHRWLNRLAAFYAPLILDELRSSCNPTEIAARWVAAHGDVVRKADVPDVDAALAWLRENAPDLRFAGGLLDRLHRDGYGAGVQVAAAQLGATPSVAISWDSWTPGHPKAAALLGNGRDLEGLMASQGASIDGISDYTLDRIAHALANALLAGDSVTSTAQRLDTILDDPQRAALIAVTETNRAMTAATLDGYRGNGVEMFDLILADDACPECEDAAADNPHELDDLDAAPPLHPSCRCSASPVLVLDDGSEIELDEE